jgi:hypothetical protein
LSLVGHLCPPTSFKSFWLLSKTIHCICRFPTGAFGVDGHKCFWRVIDRPPCLDPILPRAVAVSEEFDFLPGYPCLCVECTWQDCRPFPIEKDCLSAGTATCASMDFANIRLRRMITIQFGLLDGF